MLAKALLTIIATFALSAVVIIGFVAVNIFGGIND